MKINDFKLERYFALHEFSSPYLLCCSDCESMTVNELYSMAPETENKLKNLSLSYSESLGHPELRYEISKLYQNISPDEVLVFSGAEEAIFSFMNVFLENGDHCAVQFPAYQSLFELANSIKTDVSLVDLKFEHGWKYSIAELEKEITYRTKLIVINFPHNPTGSFPDLDTYLKIKDIAKKTGVYIFSDEVYRFLEYGALEPLPSMCDIYENSVSLNVMSKSFGLAGLRIGWIASHDKNLLNRLAAFKDYTTICNSAPSEILAIAALKNKKTIIDRNKKIIAENLDLLDSFMADHTHLFQWVRPKAGPITMIKYLGKEGATEFCRKALKARGILLLPSTLYDIGDSFFRVGFGRKNFGEGLAALREYVQENY